MRRRRLLAACSTAVGLSGCGGLLPESGEHTATSRTTEASATTPGTPTNEQFVSVKNTRPTAVYLTLGVGEAFTESFELFPGEQVRFSTTLAPNTERDVVVETAAGERATFRWTVDPTLDGLATYLTVDGVEFWRHVRCRDDCLQANGEISTDLPLVGDGIGRWYAPAGVVVQNPASTPQTADLTVALGDETLFTTRARLPAETQISVPVSYRSGDYTVTVAIGGREATTEWPVPEVPERHVTLDDSVEFGCGPANSTLTLSNRDSVEHTLAVTVARDGREVFSRRVTLPAKTDERLTPVAESGPYEVTVETESERTTATWWSCPPRGPATMLVDATGSVTLQQGGPRRG
ncbi:hypothetical protein SAMN04487950_0931 [Halogranum rubrum]|uniref:Ig-like domain-containing protein n=1 Tax=Halogranum rubrum TaxID=553466 RepID=A0A1I4C4A1_9EURY|nr:hypothetical protein [Halogranum rubrum]SFK75450.1 hypothetical protein SAMN04487950_0931 [Halogranum rubrum]